jgi:hypothetical protein
MGVALSEAKDLLLAFSSRNLSSLCPLPLRFLRNVCFFTPSAELS